MYKISSFLITLLVFTLTFCSVFWFFVLPEVRQVGQYRAEIEAGTENVNLKAISKKPATEVELANRVLALLPTSDNQYDLAVQVDALSKSLKIPLASFTMSAAAASKAAVVTEEAETKSVGAATTPLPGASEGVSLSKVSLSLSFIVSNYQDVQRFIQGLTGLGRFIQIDQLTVSSAGTAIDQITVQIIGFAYYLPSAKKL